MNKIISLKQKKSRLSDISDRGGFLASKFSQTTHFDSLHIKTLPKPDQAVMTDLLQQTRTLIPEATTQYH